MNSPSPAWDTSNDHFHSMFMQAPASIAIFRGPDHVYEFANPPYLHMLGRDSLVGKSVREALPEIKDSGIYEVLDQVYRTGEPFVAAEYPVPISKKPGADPELCYFSFNLYPLKGRTGDIYGQIVVALDITSQVSARRKLESLANELLAQQGALRDSETRFRELANAMPQIVWTARADGHVDYYNDRWYDFTGQPRGHSGDESWAPILHPEDLERAASAWYSSVKDGCPYECEFRWRDRHDGSYRWHLGRAVPIRNADGVILRWYGTATEIDAQRRAEVLARESEQSLSLAVEATGIGTWDFTPATGVLQWSKSCRAIWGLAADAPVRYEAWIGAIRAEDRPLVTGAIERALRGDDEGRYRVEFRMRRFDNDDERWLAAVGRVIFSGDGKAERFIGTTSDITDLKLATFRSRFLDEARNALSGSLDLQEQLHAVAKVAVPIIADWCAIDLVVDGTRKSLVHVHADPQRVEEAKDIRRRFPTRAGDPIIAAVSGGKAALIEDLDSYIAGRSDDPKYVAALSKLRLRSSLIVPVHVRSRLYATITLITAESGRRYGEEDRRFGDEFARHVAMAAEHAHLYRETLEARSEAETLNAVGASVASELDLEKVVQTITDAGTTACGAQFGAFFYNVLDQQGARYMLYTISGVPREKFSNFPMPRATALFGPTFRGEGVIRLADVRKDPRFGKSAPYHGHPPGHLPVVSYLAVPVRSRSGEVLGGLFFGHPEAGRFEERHERLIVGIAAQAAIALDNAQLFKNEKTARELAASQAEDLKHSNAELEQFAYISSHDLQEPLRTISQYLELLQVRFSEQLDPKAQRYVGFARDSAERMYALINDLLAYTRSGKHALARSDFDLGELVNDILKDLARVIESSKAVIAVRPLCSVSADRVLLRQALQNLVSNALKFHRDGPPQVEIACIATDRGWEITVADQGIGIDPEDHQRIFRVFQRLHRQDQFPGSGIGLAICQKIAERHDGTMRVASALGKGTTFTLVLPTSEKSAPT